MHSHSSDPEQGFNPEDPTTSPDQLQESPHHGFQGDRGVSPSQPPFPRNITVAVSREAGARGGTIGRRVGRKLGWQVYDQEMLEYMAQEMAVGKTPLQEQEGSPDPALAAWVEERLQQLLREQNLTQHPSVMDLARVVLTLSGRGQIILIGRGAGFLLPRPATLHVRILAPLQDRISYFSQWHRLTVKEATDKVRMLDERRAEYITTHFHRQPGDIHQYDMLLSSSLLGEDVCAELIAQAAQARMAAYAPAED